MASATLASLLHQIADQSRPFVTHYDLSTGERTELSARTLDNWVAKTANFLVDDADAVPGTRIRIGLPTHWLRMVWLLSCWTVGAAVVDADADVGLCGPDLAADEPVRLAASLRPFGARFVQPPAGFVDIGAEVPSHGDVFVALDPPQADALALDLAGTTTTHAQLLASTPPDSRRLMVGPGPVVRDAAALVSAAAGGGSLVLVTGAGDDAARQRITDQERVDGVWSGPLHSPE